MSTQPASPPKVVVAMSGGVDSSVAAALLVEQGYQVMGMMLRLWNEPGAENANRCCTPDDMAGARRVAAILGIPFYPIDAQSVFYDQVVRYLIDGYAQGATPNPCLACNRQVRWDFLLNHALAFGAQFLATGHYARLQRGGSNQVRLLQGLDPSKDQAYVLHVLTQEKLQHALFPLGEYTKPQVRQLAHHYHLPVAERPESQDLCFLGRSNYREFLSRHAPQAAVPGPILSSTGETIGQHTGLPHYTIGQRKGLGISAPQPVYVLSKDLARNALIVGDVSQLGTSELLARSVNWIAGSPPPKPFPALVKIRYRAQGQPALVTPLPSGDAHVVFDQPPRDVTPGQAAVFFDGELCLGGGIIAM